MATVTVLAGVAPSQERPVHVVLGPHSQHRLIIELAKPYDNKFLGAIQTRNVTTGPCSSACLCGERIHSGRPG